MKKKTLNRPLRAGLGLYALSMVLGRLVDLPHMPYMVLLLGSIALMLWGAVLFGRSPAVRNSRLGRLKRRLLGPN